MKTNMEKIILPNGLRVLLLPIEGARSVSAGVWIEAGSRYEPAEMQGISHFTEHMLFKGTGRRSARRISEEMDLLGGGLNAYTTKEYTRYYAQTLSENAAAAWDLLCDMITDSRMAPEDTALERGVILEEIAMYEDAGEDLAHEALCASVWPRSPLGRPICGTRESVASITPKDLKSYVRENYTPERMVAVTAGGFDREAVLETLSAGLGHLQPGIGKPPTDTPAFTPGLVLRKKDFEQVSIELGMPGVPAVGTEDSRRYEMMLLNFIVGGGASSRLFQRLREELGLVYSIYSANYASRGAGLFTIAAALAPGRQEQALQEIRAVLASMTDGITQEEFLRAKAQVKASYILGLETVAQRASYIGRNELMEGKAIDSGEVLTHLDAVTIPDIEKLAAQLFSAPACLSAAGPVAAAKFYKPYI